MLCSSVHAYILVDTIIVDEDFESYTSDAELIAAWPAINPGGTNPDAVPNNGTTLTTDPDSRYGGMIDGQAAEFCGQPIFTGVCGSSGGGGTVNQWSTPFNIAPSATHNVVLSFDLGDDGLSDNKRLTVGLRHTDPPQNIIEMGLFNAPFAGFSYRTVLFAEGDTYWINFNQEGVVDQHLPTGMHTPMVVGPGVHRFEAIIRTNSITFTLDLFADGLTNDPNNLTHGIGTPGVDAMDTIPIALLPGGFNDLRFGLPSALPASGGIGDADAAFATFDNISLRLVVIPEPTSATLACVLGIGLATRRRRL